MTSQPTKQQILKQWARSTKDGASSKPVSMNKFYKPSRFTIPVRLAGGDLLLFNSMTRCLCRINCDEVHYWNDWADAGKIVRGEQDDLIDDLAGDGYIVPYELDELALAKNKYFAARNDTSKLMLTIAPTMACNLACGYCFQGLDKDVGKLDDRLPEGIMDFIREHKDISSLHITWYGGEPLMAKEKIFSLSEEMIKHCDERGLQYHAGMVTNGYFLTPKMARKLMELRVSSAQVTIDGLEETHDQMRPLTSGRGSFKTILKNIVDVLNETNFGISLRVNVGRQNVDECSRLMEELESLGLGHRNNFSIYFAPIDAATAESGTAFDESLGRKDFNAAVWQLTERGRDMGLVPAVTAPAGIMGMCVAATNNGYVVTHKGDLHKCWETAHDPRKRIGSIFETKKLDKNLNRKIWQEWSPFDSDICKSCKILPMCGGFCGHRFMYSGAGDGQALPCPEWKWSTAEHIFSRACKQGYVEQDEWLPEENTAEAMQSGQRQSAEALRVTQERVLAKVNRFQDRPVDTDFLLNGDGRFFE